MPIFSLDAHNHLFPPAWMAEENGLLAVGGDMHPDRLLAAYQAGIFPWYDASDAYPLWWSPDPRFVLYPQKLRVSKTMRQVLRRGEYRISLNEAFDHVVALCGQVPRRGQLGTWITPDLRQAYLELHRRGITHSVEAWHEGQLVGGLFGASIGACFVGESMFALRSNASKAAFIVLVQELERLGFELIDCQLHTEHLESLGAEHIGRDEYIDTLHRSTSIQIDADWPRFFGTK